MDVFSTAFDFDAFETQWENLSVEKKVLLVKETDNLEPEFAIILVLKGILSYHSSVRNTAKKSLGNIQSKITDLLAAPSNKELF